MKPERIALKIATGEMNKGVGGVEAAAGFCRVGKSVLSDAQNFNCTDRFVTIDVVADLEPLAREREGWPHVTRALCHQMGGVFVPLPQVEVRRDDLLGSIARLAKENADVAASVCDGLKDGEFGKADAVAARIQVREMLEVAAALDAQLGHLVGDI